MLVGSGALVGMLSGASWKLCPRACGILVSGRGLNLLYHTDPLTTGRQEVPQGSFMPYEV